MPNQHNSKGRSKQVLVKLSEEEFAELSEKAWRARARSPASYLRALAGLRATARLEAKHARTLARKEGRKAA